MLTPGDQHQLRWRTEIALQCTPSHSPDCNIHFSTHRHRPRKFSCGPDRGWAQSGNRNEKRSPREFLTFSFVFFVDSSSLLLLSLTSPLPQTVTMASQDIKALENGPEYQEEDVKIAPPAPIDPFGEEDSAEVKYKTLTWWYVLLLWAMRDTITDTQQANRS